MSDVRSAPQMQFSTANHPDQWWADGDVINFVTAEDAKKAESIFNALSNEVNRLRALRSERAPTQSLLDKLTPLTFELGSPRAALYSDDTVMIPWGYVKEALKNAAPQEAGMFDHLNVGASVSAAPPNSGDGWIPMKERQPEDFQAVLCVNSAGYMATANRFSFGDGRWDGAYYTAEDAGPSIGEITHWMPLPAAPI